MSLDGIHTNGNGHYVERRSPTPARASAAPDPFPRKSMRGTATGNSDVDRLTLRIPEACHGPSGQSDHAHEIAIKACLVPKELYEHIVEAGVTKSKWRLDKHIVMGLLAGFYIGFSFTFMMVIGGQIPEIQKGPNKGIYNMILGVFGFPLGLFMICVVGADLFTSNCSYMVTALHEGKVSIWATVKMLVISWFVNLAGGIIFAELVYAAAIFEGRSEYVLWLAEHKTSYTFSVCMCKAILANWLVNMAVWMANAAQDVSGKFIGIFVPISAFISMGGEHCIANQFVFSIAMLLGSDLTVGEVITKNLIPATIGNLIGGMFFVGTMYSFALGTLFDSTYSNTARVYRNVLGKPHPENLTMQEHAAMQLNRDHRWHSKLTHAIITPHWLHCGAGDELDNSPRPGVYGHALPPQHHELQSDGTKTLSFGTQQGSSHDAFKPANTAQHYHNGRGDVETGQR